ncbi:MAG TPA: hypothetical protein VGS79_15990 [Puia sp.]|nr:hypothetical protein [Puia sp.]
MKRYFLSSLLLLPFFFTNMASAQDTLDKYLSSHAYPIDMKDPGGGPGCSILAGKLGGYRVIMLGEGGSHELEFYFDLRSTLLEQLNKRLGVHSFVMEYGSALAVLLNRYLETGDTGCLPPIAHPGFMRFLRELYIYDHSPATLQPIRTVGLDFERTGTYFKALRLLMPSSPAPEPIKNEIEMIKNSSDSMDCDALIRIDKYLKHSLEEKQPAYVQYLGRSYTAVSDIITNPGLCNSRLKNRNFHLVERFEHFDSQYRDSIYFCELGEAHVNFILKNASWLLDMDKNSPFFHRVAVINVYCDNCETPVEKVSNWSFGSLQKDIESRFLPYCRSDFTLFDLTASDDPAIGRFAASGQFLLIVKGLH